MYLKYGIDVCMKNTYPHTVPTRKVTMNLPVDLIENAQKYLGKSSLTEAVRHALREELHRQGCMELMKARGTFDPEIDWKALRNDD
jgi:hypothetical protein